MYEDIHKIDSTILKPNPTEASRKYRGNSKKKNNKSDQENDANEEQAGEESTDNKAKAAHVIDLKA